MTSPERQIDHACHGDGDSRWMTGYTDRSLTNVQADLAATSGPRERVSLAILDESARNQTASTFQAAGNSSAAAYGVCNRSKQSSLGSDTRSANCPRNAPSLVLHDCLPACRLPHCPSAGAAATRRARTAACSVTLRPRQAAPYR